MARSLSPKRSEQLRSRLAQEAARILAEEGVRDYLVAKRKAADRLGLGGSQQRGLIPNNVEIESALTEYLRLFQGEEQEEHLREMRQAAAEAMKLLKPFSPRLVGGVLDGNATLHSDIGIHVFADMPEAVYMHLMDKGIPVDIDERRLRRANGNHADYPVYRFIAGDVGIDITVFGIHERGHAPKSPVDGKPMRRGTLADLEALLAT
ncbi:hypothetical protein [Natronospira bacteriovora]|uniref:Uncharacterized protein n=1 Tax=Natronospira bacteriovora TaxID=3069753 RepID=A0ABU0W842_9GAMM|nr:hypothetical protein [Natronospira sp. AB-CW4]MDQ2070212.1 hypothetical protein [Natronospira sp. AB-CW4]